MGAHPASRLWPVIYINPQTLSLDLELAGVRTLTIILKAHQTTFLVLHTVLFPDAFSKATTTNCSLGPIFQTEELFFFFKDYLFI